MSLPSLRNHFKDLHTYCMFIGYPKSGHTLVRAILDAHPNMVMANEFNALEYIGRDFSAKWIFEQILDVSKAQANEGNKWQVFNYHIPNQYQGTYKKLEVIGDKKGGRSAHLIYKDPSLLQKLIDTIPVPIKFVHVTRNPFDNISSLFRLPSYKGNKLDENINAYLSRAKGVKLVKDTVSPENILDIKHEDFVQHPKEWTSKLIDFLGLENSTDHLQAAASLVKEVNVSRKEVDWDKENRLILEREIAKYPWLADYTFDS